MHRIKFAAISLGLIYFLLPGRPSALPTIHGGHIIVDVTTRTEQGCNPGVRGNSVSISCVGGMLVRIRAGRLIFQNGVPVDMEQDTTLECRWVDLPPEDRPGFLAECNIGG